MKIIKKIKERKKNKFCEKVHKITGENFIDCQISYNVYMIEKKIAKKGKYPKWK